MFASFKKLPDDPILGLAAQFKVDPNPNKIDLGVGVYKNEQGITPIFEAVKRAEAVRLELEKTKTYTGIEGDPVFCEEIQSLILGKSHPALSENRTSAIATPGGSGALRVGGELIDSWLHGANLWVSQPSWPNHIPLLATAGLTTNEYPYYDYGNHSICFEAMLDQLNRLGSEDFVLLHGCCQNPTGCDPTDEQWRELSEVARKRKFIPFVDFAYQGLARGLDEDAYGARLLAEAVPEMLIAFSCSKNFGLYRDRIGALMVVTQTPDSATAAFTHMKSIARRLYSLPPAHGAMIVASILTDAELRSNWQNELNKMRHRINSLRSLLVETLEKKGSPRDFSFIATQYGLFSFLDLNKEQVERLRNEFSVYLVNNSRINIAGVSPNNVEYLAESIIAVL